MSMSSIEINIQLQYIVRILLPTDSLLIWFPAHKKMCLFGEEDQGSEK